MQPLREGRTLSDQISAGLTWILPAAVLVVLSVLVPFYVIYGMEGTGEMLQLVKPLSMLPYTIIRMLVVYAGIYLLAAVLFASVEYYNLDMIISIGYRVCFVNKKSSKSEG